MPPQKNTDELLELLKKKYSHQPTFLQAVSEMMISLKPLFEDTADGEYFQRVFWLLTEPEKIIRFRVTWTDDGGKFRTNIGYRVEWNSALGSYKGGLRFHPTVDEGILKGLAFEQTFKNALTGLRIGGAKGGSDFDPKDKSEGEIRRFCAAFMSELSRYIHPATDVPAGDIGVGEREMGYLWGKYKQLTNRHSDGALTGKPILLGGSALRTEATGFGVVYIAKMAIEKHGGSLKGARCAISGSGNVSQYASKKLIDLGAKVVSVSDSDGVLIFENGMTDTDWNVLIQSKQEKRARLSSIVNEVTGIYTPCHSPWTIPSFKLDYAFPCATENEIDSESVTRLISSGMKGLFEGANLPTIVDAQKIMRDHKTLYIPGKAANAGGVAVSGFEMAQNIQILSWTEDKVDEKLWTTMKYIYKQMEAMVEESGCTLEQAANRVSFLKLAKAIHELGWVW